tara:strand:+ start:361 stop:576 length:216 start_codon:yes stop_codon:yes gene_type:complete
MIPILLSSLVLLSGGCGSTRVVFVDTQADLVRIGPDAEARVYVLKNGEWVLSKNKVKLPEGWYAGGIPREE